jgi:glycosyltransferase involved in cell wall biosynthesis
MKIAVFLQDLSGGGAERMMVQLAGGIANCGVGVDLVLVRPEGPYLEDVSKNVRIVDLAARRTLNSVFRLARYIKRERPAALLSALVHVNVAAILAARLAGRSTRVVISERNTISLAANGVSTAAVRLAHRLVPRIYPLADEIVAVSQGVAEDLAQFGGLPLERITVIKNPVITPRLAELAGQLPDHPWFTADQVPVVLGVGRLTEQKDFGTLLRAFADVRKHETAKLVILGDGPDRSELERLAGELGLGEDVDMPGFVQNPYAFMSRAALLALSSRWEGSPNVLVESMDCGTPVVATDCPNGPSEILEAGRYGRLVPVGDPQQLAAAILATLRNPPAPDLLRRKSSEYTIEASARCYLQTLLGKPAVPRIDPVFH